MKTAITNTLVKSLKPQAKPYEVRDTELKGLLIRVQPSGMMSYYAEYARAKRIRIGRHPEITPTQARDKAKIILAEAHLGNDPMEARRENKIHTLESFVDERYTPWAEAHIKTHEDTIARLKASFPLLLPLKLNEITPWLVEKWRSDRLKLGRKKSTVNRDLNDLKSCLAKAVEWEILEAHPLAKVRRIKEDPTGLTRFLSPDEEIRLRKALDKREDEIRSRRATANDWRKERGYDLYPDLSQMAYADHLKPLVLLSMNTGLRQGELFNLRWSEVDLHNKTLTVRGDAAKSGKTRHIPLSDEAMNILTGWKAQTDNAKGLVFPGKGGKPLDNVTKSWATLLSKEWANISNFRWHDLRHHFASRLRMEGVDITIVRDLLGHTDLKMTMRYAHIGPNHVIDAIAKLKPIVQQDNIHELTASEAGHG
jgi:integrase